MRRRMLLAVLMMAAAAAPVAQAQPAQRDTGVPTETQERLARGVGAGGFDWNWLGLFGLLGLLGLRKRHSDDSYHPAPLE